MKPSQVMGPNNDVPAVIFRPTFYANGLMLQAAVLSIIASKKAGEALNRAKDTSIGRIQAEMHTLFNRYGMSYFLSEEGQPIHISHENPEIAKLAEAVCHVTFPEFFNETKDQVDAKYKDVLDALQPAQPAADTNTPPAQKKSRKGAKNDTAAVAPTAPQEQPPIPADLTAAMKDVLGAGEPAAPAPVVTTATDELNKAVQENKNADVATKAAKAAKKSAPVKKPEAPKTTRKTSVTMPIADNDDAPVVPAKKTAAKKAAAPKKSAAKK